MNTPALRPAAEAAPAHTPAERSAPASALLLAFAAALQRAKSRGQPGDDPAAGPDPMPLGAPAPRPAAIAPAPWAPQPAAEAGPAQQRHAALAALPPAPALWRLEVVDPAGPLRAVELQRTPEGALHVALTATAAATAHERTLPSERLRQRLGARGASLAWREEPER